MLTAGCLALLGLLHAYWGFGGHWPARDHRALADVVAGTLEMPSAIACHGVAVLLWLAALLMLSASGALALPLPRWVVVLGGWTPVVVLALRGLGGFFEARFRPEMQGFRYQRWSLRLYSPLCLSLAALGATEIS